MLRPPCSYHKQLEEKMAKVSKNQRTDRGRRDASTPMAKVVVAEKKANGEYRYRERMVPQSEVQDVLKEARG